ncbi:MAG: LCP family protein [Clostridia bacterium]|nr:LCP family protein [Clostridia bacterium]
MKMKRFIALLLVTVISVFALAGCKNEEKVDETVVVTAVADTKASTTVSAAEKETTTAPEETTEAEAFYTQAAPAPLYAHDSVTNILLIGTDSNSDWGRSDTLMLLSLDNIHGKIKMTSFLRDTFVSIPGYDPDKLNAAYAYGGTDLCIQTIEYNFGIDVDGYAIVNFSTFRQLINAIGGVDVYLTQDEIDYINAQVAQNDQPNYLEGASEGYVHLSGGQALWHVRNRGGEVNGEYFYGTDWDRVDRQQRMFAGIINGLTSLSFDEVSKMAYTVLPYVSTNLSAAEIAGHISNAPAYLSYSIERATFPTDYWTDSYYDYAGSVLEITDWNALRRDVATFIYENIG